MPIDNTSESNLVLSYLTLRRIIGFIGIGLPFALAVGKILLGEPGLQSSISGYYYTNVRNVLVGSLCAIGVFMLSYRGYEKRDRWAGNFACAFAIGVALFPVAPDPSPSQIDTIIGRVHLAFATAMFLTLAYFCLALFTKTDSIETMTKKKKERNIVYKICGWMIVACIALIIACELLFLNDYSLFKDSPIKQLDPVFWLESIAILAFGFSWLTKGEFILADEG
jgi:hypothetical protein